jgi:hypothetical protein
MDITTEIKDGATVSVSLDLAPEGISHIRIMADSAEARDRALAQVQKVLPQIQSLEDALIAEDLKHDPLVKRSWFIRLNLTDFFQAVRDGEVITTHDYAEHGACFTDHQLGSQCVLELRKLKIDSRIELLTAPRRLSTVTTNLEAVGLNQ